MSATPSYTLHTPAFLPDSGVNQIVPSAPSPGFQIPLYHLTQPSPDGAPWTKRVTMTDVLAAALLLGGVGYVLGGELGKALGGGTEKPFAVLGAVGLGGSVLAASLAAGQMNR